MPKITYIPLAPGVSIINSECQVLVNTVNCVGVMGKGVALAFKQKYPTIMGPYINYCHLKVLRPGMILPWRPGDGKLVLNAATKDHYRDPSQEQWVVDILCGLSRFEWEKYHFTSLAIPPLGCGEGKLKWEVIGPLMVSFLDALPLERIDIYLSQEQWGIYHGEEK